MGWWTQVYWVGELLQSLLWSKANGPLQGDLSSFESIRAVQLALVKLGKVYQDPSSNIVVAYINHQVGSSCKSLLKETPLLLKHTECHLQFTL